MIALLFSPIGKYIAIGAIVVVVMGGVYAKIRADAISDVVAASAADSFKRTQDALAAGDSAAISPERLLEDDGHRRD
jgi:hypothetical protein